MPVHIQCRTQFGFNMYHTGEDKETWVPAFAINTSFILCFIHCSLDSYDVPGIVKALSLKVIFNQLLSWSSEPLNKYFSPCVSFSISNMKM